MSRKRRVSDQMKQFEVKFDKFLERKKVEQSNTKQNGNSKTEQ